jgi:glycosyltransferase involved in cell wall biosynthesis
MPVPAGEIYANQELALRLADELADRGEDVTLFAPQGSVTRARLVTFEMLPFCDPRMYTRFRSDRSFSDYEHLFMARIYRYTEDHRFDLLHMHLRPLSVAPFAAAARVPTLQTIHDPLSYEYFKLLELYNDFPQIGFVTLSRAQGKALPGLQLLAQVYNGIDLQKWSFNPVGGDRFCWSGRVIREKAPHRAIAAARRLGTGLDLAGFVYASDRHQTGSYWNTQVRPLLGPDVSLDYVPAADLPAFYGRAKAFINPLDWEEPFGLVMIEAMACGTPVVAFDRGSVREIVQDGVSGFVVQTEEEMAEALRRIDTISRAGCRRYAEEKFSLRKMADDYLAAYKQLIERKR